MANIYWAQIMCQAQYEVWLVQGHVINSFQSWSLRLQLSTTPQPPAFSAQLE